MKEIKTEFKPQKRWDDKGKLNLQKIKKNPELFIYNKNNIVEFSKAKQGLIKTLLKGKPSTNELNNLNILELGSGCGEFSIILAKMGANVTGIDIGANLVDLSVQTALLNNVTCKFVVGSIDRLTFDDCSFDYVIGNSILHHLPVTGVKDSIAEAYRVLKYGGQAFFTEPIENSKFFDFIQSIIPVGKKGTSYYRPSILNRKEWRQYLKEADNRDLSNNELIAAKGAFDSISFTYYGFLIRLGSLYHDKRFINLLSSLDILFTHKFSPFKRLSQKALIIYRKNIK